MGFTRTFRTGVGLVLNNSDFDDTYGTRNLILNPNGFPGFTGVASTFDHYRITRVRCFLHNRWPTAATANSGQQPRESSVTTTLWTVVDHSLLASDPVSTPQSIQNFQNARSHVFPCNTQVKVADFRPRITASSGANVIRNQTTWVPTNSTTTWSGLRVLARNAGGVILFPSPSLQQQCYLYFSVDVEFQQPQLSATTVPSVTAFPVDGEPSNDDPPGKPESTH